MHDTAKPILIAKICVDVAAEGPARIERKPSTRETGYKQHERNCSSANHLEPLAANPAVAISRTDASRVQELLNAAVTVKREIKMQGRLSFCQER
jgi:hypothetical protein